MVQTLQVVLDKRELSGMIVELRIEAASATVAVSSVDVSTGDGERRIFCVDEQQLGGVGREGAKAKQRFHLRNYVHYGHHVNLGHKHNNLVRANRRSLLRCPSVNQPTDWIEKLVEDKARMIEMHAF